MSRWSTDRKITLGFFAACILLAVLPIVVLQHKGRLLNSGEWLAHTHEVLAKLDATQSALADAETGQRGYCLTGDETFLQPYRRGERAWTDRVAELRRLTADNERQQSRLKALEALAHEKFQFMGRVIAARKSSGLAGASAMVQTGEGKFLMDRFRRLLDEMRLEESDLLRQRHEALRAGMHQGIRFFWAVALLNFIILGVSFWLINRYISQRNRAGESLRRAKEAAEAANVAKSAFLANMSHEIRTPMTAIVGYSEMLLEPDQTPSDKFDCLQVIRRNARHLLELINDVLDLSKIEAGKMALRPADCDLAQLVSDVVSMMRPRAIEKGLTFALKYDGPIPRRVRTDPLRVKQVLVNLLGNAVKFTQTGGVELRVGCRFETSRGNTGATAATTLLFTVADTGIGIAPEEAQRLFLPFAQADESTTRRFGGTGLGLAISHRLARLLGGEVTVRSAKGKGSAFTLAIDAGEVAGDEVVRDPSESLASPAAAIGSVAATAAAAPAAPAAVEPRILLDGRVLLVEDGPDNQRLIAGHLRKAGAAVTVAENGRIGVDMAMSCPFDVILMDMQMPELDGYAATSELRRRGLQLPIVALTAHAMLDDRAKCLGVGCTDYLTKPVDKQQLLLTVQRYLAAASAAGAARDRATSRPVLRSMFAAEPEMKQVLAEYVAGLPKQVEQLLQLLERRDGDTLRRTVHQIKGAGGGYGFQPITEAAAKAERLIMSGAPADAVAQQVRELADVMRSVEGFDGSGGGSGGGATTTQLEAA